MTAGGVAIVGVVVAVTDLVAAQNQGADHGKLIFQNSGIPGSRLPVNPFHKSKM